MTTTAITAAIMLSMMIGKNTVLSSVPVAVLVVFGIVSLPAANNFAEAFIVPVERTTQSSCSNSRRSLVSSSSIHHRRRQPAATAVVPECFNNFYQRSSKQRTLVNRLFYTSDSRNNDASAAAAASEACELGDLCDIPDEIYSTTSTSTSSSSSSSSSEKTLAQDLADTQLGISFKNWIESSPFETKYKTTKPIVLDNGDRISKIAMYHYPVAVCGGTSGSLYLVDLQLQEVLDIVVDAHDPIGDGIGVPTTTTTTTKTKTTILGKRDASNHNHNDNDDDDVVQKNTIKIKDKQEQLKRALKLKHGFFIGKGIVTIAMNQNLVVTAGREGGGCVWDIVDTTTTNDNKKNKTKKLVFRCQLPAEQDTVVTALRFDSKQRLWTGSYDGTIRVYDTYKQNNKDGEEKEKEDEEYSMTPTFSMDYHQGPILDISLSDDFQCGACACADGPIQLFDYMTGSFITSLETFKNGIRPKSVLLLKDNEGNGNLICGGSDGSLYRHYLQLDSECTDLAQAFGTTLEDAECQIDMWDPLTTTTTSLASSSSPSSSSSSLSSNSKDGTNPNQKERETRLKPAHTGPIMCLESPHKGMFLSAAQDGTVKVWGCNSSTANSATTTTSTGNGDDDSSKPASNTTNNNSDYSKYKKYFSPNKKSMLPKCRFILKGYTPYMSNICTDGVRIISDGCRNKLNMRDFSLQLD